ncbi:MAG: type II toxin-antitoxin system ParD family antitoxin [Rhizobiales bacterium]|nr:type II toxin-antitoxin system ParD family antitoxin [Hyphomicrobiales bacterium]MBI3674820.1 type II toxin-antitoxin system ParD family antitoxin [Hyphomicrobiales bacterium]
MATMNVSLPDKMKEWVEAQTRLGRFGNASDYVRDLIRRDQEGEAFRRRVQKAIDEALASGMSDLPIDEVFRKARASGDR